ncbi:MAG: F0F1 ATP synthase subunit gamma [Alphaproteobacteria bacterium]
MPSLESLQKRIKTTEDMRDIVSMMKTLSSVSILQYDEALSSLKGYRKNITDAFHALVKRGNIPPNSFNTLYRNGRTLVILMGTDSGLVGRFNTELLEQAFYDLSEEKERLSDTLFIGVGKRVIGLLASKKVNLFAKYAVSNSIKTVNSLAGTLIVKIYEAIQKEKVSSVIVYYHKCEPAGSTSLEKIKLLPSDKGIYEKLRKKKWDTNNVPLITMSPKKLFEVLIKEYLMIELCSMLTYSLSAEHHTRMVNMQNAEKNIDESLEKLNLEYQQKRQDAITEELIDVVSGAEALKKK